MEDLTETTEKLPFDFYRTMAMKAAEKGNTRLAMDIIQKFVDYDPVVTGNALSDDDRHRVAATRIEVVGIATEDEKRGILESIERPENSLDYILNIAAHNKLIPRRKQGAK